MIKPFYTISRTFCSVYIFRILWFKKINIELLRSNFGPLSPDTLLFIKTLEHCSNGHATI